MLPNALLNKVPRPQFHQAFAAVTRPYIDVWITGLPKKISQREYEEFLAGLPPADAGHTIHNLLESLAFGIDGTPDAFQLATNLKVVLGWPSDADLVSTLKTGIEHTPRQLRWQTIDWVMRNMIRFDKKVGDDCVFYYAPIKGNRMGKVESIDRPVATGRVKIGNDLVTVLAEQVVS